MIIDNIDDLPQVSFPDLISDHVLTGGALQQLIDLHQFIHNIDREYRLTDIRGFVGRTEEARNDAEERVKELKDTIEELHKLIIDTGDSKLMDDADRVMNF